MGEPGTQLTLRTFHIGGAAGSVAEKTSIKVKTEGTVVYYNLRVIRDRYGDLVVMNRQGGVGIRDTKGREREKYKVSYGAKLKFGDGDAAIDMVEQIAQGTEFGKILGNGPNAVGKLLNHKRVPTVKGQSIAAYDPRAIKGIGLEYATSNRGACHVRGYTVAAEVLGHVDRLKYEGKAELTKTFQDLTAALDSTGICLFTTFGLVGKNIAALYSTATGFECDEKEFLKIGERIWNLEKLFNLKAGFTRKDDTLPLRILKEPIKTGPSKGEIEELDKMLDNYYKVRGWGKDGVPMKEKLEELELSDLI